MKKPKSKGKAHPHKGATGPKLTNAQKVRIDLAKSKMDRLKARGYRAEGRAEAAAGQKKTAAQDMARAKKDAAGATKYKLKAAKVGYARPLTPAGGWIGGRGDQFPLCLAAAAANSLLAVTGHQVTDDDVLRLHAATGRDLAAGRPIEDILHELLTGGLAGIRPRAARPIPTTATALWPGAVAVVLVPGWEPHAVTVASGGVTVTWGGPGPAGLLEHATEAWAIDW